MANDLSNNKKWLESERKLAIDFWLNNGWDKEHGGIYTSLDRKGEIYSTDKSIWMQGRTSWTYAYLYNNFQNDPELLEFAKSCIDFSNNHAFNPDAEGRMYFSATEDGKGLRQRRYVFSELFYALGNMEYYKATGETSYLEDARKTYDLATAIIKSELDDPFVIPEKTNSETRSMKTLSPHMIIMNVGISFAEIDTERRDLYIADVQNSVNEIVDFHFKEDTHITYENIGTDGEILSDISEGRLMNPGHVIECSWFLMDAAVLLEDKELLNKSFLMLDKAVQLGWDEVHGGLLYFIDLEDKPVYQLESDMKLWWPQTELLIASIKAYRLSGDEKYLDLFDKTLNYWQDNFADSEFGDCYGYLHYDNTVAMSGVKGGLFKGPFHLIRALQFAVEEIELVENK